MSHVLTSLRQFVFRRPIRKSQRLAAAEEQPPQRAKPEATPSLKKYHGDANRLDR